VLSDITPRQPPVFTLPGIYLPLQHASALSISDSSDPSDVLLNYCTPSRPRHSLSYISAISEAWHALSELPQERFREIIPLKEPVSVLHMLLHVIENIEDRLFTIRRFVANMGGE
jgi:hypothetical protein